MKTYGTMTLTVTSPAQSFTEPITLAEAKAALRLPDFSPTDTEADELIEGYITAVRQLAETAQGRDLVAQQWDYRLDAFPAGDIQLREPLASVNLVQYKGEDAVARTLVENTDYIVDTARALVTLPESVEWPSAELWPTSAVLIRFTTSAPAVIDQVVISGMKMALIALWSNEPVPECAERMMAHGAVPRHA